MGRTESLSDFDVRLLKNIVSGDGLPGFVDFQIAAYYRESPSKREAVIADWRDQSVTQPWAWDALMALLKRAHERDEPRPALLVQFAEAVALGEMDDPRNRPGHPPRDMARDFRILAAVHWLVERHGYTKSEAREIVADLPKVGMEPDSIRRKITGRLKPNTPFFRPNPGPK